MYSIENEQKLNDSFLKEWLLGSAGKQVLSKYDFVFYYIENQRWNGNGSLLILMGEEVPRMTFEEYLQRIHPEDREKYLAEINEAKSKISSYHTHYRFLRADGTYVPIADSGNFFIGASEFPTAAGIITLMDHQSTIQNRFEAKVSIQDLLKEINKIANHVDTAEEFIILSLKHICNKTHWAIAHACMLNSFNYQVKISPSIVYTSQPQRYLQLIEYFHQNRAIPPIIEQNVIDKKKAQWMQKADNLFDDTFNNLLHEAGLKHAIVFPIIFSNEVVGTIEFYTEKLECSEDWISELMDQLGSQLSLIVELKVSNEHLRKLTMAIEQNFTSIEITDANGVIEYVNPIFCEVTGYTSAEVIGKKPSILKSGVHPDAFYAQLWQTISSGQKWQGEICNRRKDGSLFWEQVTISPVKNARNEIINYIAVKFDITAKRQYEEQLKKAKEEAEAANKAKSEFLANMSHEIRTPMNAILGFTEVLLQKITDEQLKSYLDSIKNSGKNLLTLINDVLDLSKIEAGKMKITREFIDPFVLFKDIEYLFSLRAQEKGLDFKIITDLNLPMGIEIDEVRLRQIVINLIGNAIKFTEKGSVMVHVSTIPASTEHVDLKIEVKDTGIGIDPQHLQKIFEPFTQLENASTKRYGGTGLGLTITRRLVEMLGGTISVQSEPNRGSTFTVLFKNVRCTNRRQQNIDMLNIDPSKILFQPALVIIADDVDNNRKYLKTVIQDTNLEVIESTNGIDTFELAKMRRPQLIITDLKMPGLNGFELLSKLRNDPLTRHIPVIATTASASIEEQDKLKVHRFDGILIKPIQINDVYIELMRFLPHEIKDDASEQENLSDISITAKADADIRTVKAILENELMTIWKTFEEQQPLNEVESFANAIRDLGKKYDLEILISYGNRLLAAINNFDIDLILKILFDYPKLLNTFKVVNED